jgi:type IV fimbrial biogenesis protein FimT
MKKESGFTMLELLIIIAMLGVVAAIAVPNFLGILPTYRLKSATQDLLSNLQRAKITAVERNQDVGVTFETGQYTIFVDENGTRDPTGQQVIRTQSYADYNDPITATNNFALVVSGKETTAFAPTGLLVQANAAGNVVLTNSKGRSMTVVVSMAGGIWIQ